MGNSNIEKEKILFLKRKLSTEVLKRLMNLPAYRLESKSRIVFEEHAYAKLDKTIAKIKFDEFYVEDKKTLNQNKFIQEVYQPPKKWEIIKYSFTFLSERDKIIGWIALISCFIAFFLM
jgi:hypothetical protein